MAALLAVLLINNGIATCLYRVRDHYASTCTPEAVLHIAMFLHRIHATMI